MLHSTQGGGNMRAILWSLVLLLVGTPFVSANIYVTEIMHSPSISDNDGEWIEIYNDGIDPVNLNNWTVNGNAFDYTTIEAGQYLVIARELIDGTDTDTESFESHWGNNNGIWDESFAAVDGSFTLTNNGTITVTNGIINEEVNYNSSFGGAGGKSIERVSLTEWKDGLIDGTPGNGNFTATATKGNEVILDLTVSNSAPEIVLVNIMTDDSSAPGVQVMPNIGLEKNVVFEVFVNDSNGYRDVSSVVAFVNNQSFNLSFARNISTSVAQYTGSFSMAPSDLAGVYNMSVEATDGSATVLANVSFEYLGILSTELNTTHLSFDLQPGMYDTKEVIVMNSGNVLVDTEVSAESFTGTAGTINTEYLSVFNGDWSALTAPVALDLNILPSSTAAIPFRLYVPQDAREGSYTGKVVITSMES